MRWRILLSIGRRKLLAGRCPVCGWPKLAIVRDGIMREWPNNGRAEGMNFVGNAGERARTELRRGDNRKPSPNDGGGRAAADSETGRPEPGSANSLCSPCTR